MNEQALSNMSYTNKDFRSVYPELLDLVKTLTNKWDPSLSNESDPGVILIKLNALIADKCNYNIDKNILELFPLSVTQAGNARELYDSLGYSMHWYKSATTSISFKWLGEKDENKSYTIPAFTMITDANHEVTYSLINDVSLRKITEIATGDAIEGVNLRYEINGETTIKLNNLDADLRLYFKERQIAENGIFINNLNSPATEWTKVDNLESTPLGRKVYKFGVLPNSDTCYIQFPQDIANLIENGLNITYIISSGEAGNILTNTLEAFTTDLVEQVSNANGTVSDTVVNDLIMIYNINSALNGSDPESLDDAYRNYKKTVSTFNNLITCKDYENAIFNLPDYNHPQYDYIVSNCVVSDRTNDINNSYYIQVLDELGERRELVVTKKSPSDEPTMTAFDLGLYLLSPMSNIYDKASFDTSFKPNPSLAIDVNQALEDYKSVQHDYINLARSPRYLYRNDYTLDCKVMTYYKVSEAEANQILASIILELYKNYNARKLDFGSNIDYDNLSAIIENADSRIKSIILDEPEYNIKVVDSENNINSLDKDAQLDIVSKSVLAGVTPFFKFDDRFDYEFGQVNINTSKPSDIISEIKQITTHLDIPTTDLYHTKKYGQAISYKLTLKNTNILPINADTSYQLKNGEKIEFKYLVDGQEHTDIYSYDTASIIVSNFNITAAEGVCAADENIEVEYRDKGIQYELQENQNIQLIGPNFQSVAEYSIGVYYTFEGLPSVADGEIIIPANQYYQLTTGQKLILEYTQNNIEQKREYTEGTIIFLNFNVTKGKAKVAAIGEFGKPGYIPAKAAIPDTTAGNLGTEKRITIKDLIQTDLALGTTIPQLYCYWVTNQISDNRYVLPLNENNSEYILKTGEYFMYTFDLASAELIILGPGTRIKSRHSAILNNPSVPQLPLDSIYDNGMSAFSSSDWAKFNSKNKESGQTYGPNDPGFLITEMQIITLGKGCTITAVVDSDISSIGNNLVNVRDIIYKDPTAEDADETRPDTFNMSDESWKIMSNLQLHVSATLPQTLKTYESIDIYTVEDVRLGTLPTTIGEGTTLLTSHPTLIIGGDKIDVGVLEPSGIIDYSLSAYYYKQDENQLISNRGPSDFLSVDIFSTDADKDLKFNFNLEAKAEDDGNEFIIPVIFVKANPTDQIKFNCEQMSTDPEYDTSDPSIKISETILDESGTYYLNPHDQTELKITLMQNGSAYTDLDTFTKDTSVEIKLNKGFTFDNLQAGTMYEIGDESTDLISYIKFNTSKKAAGYVIFNAIPSSVNFDASDNTIFRYVLNVDDIIKYSSNPLWTSRLYIGKITKTFGYALDESDYAFEIDELKAYMSILDSTHKFNFTYRIDDEKLIENPILPESFWNKNHIYNRYTLAKLDIDNSSIKLLKSSKL